MHSPKHLLTLNISINLAAIPQFIGNFTHELIQLYRVHIREFIRRARQLSLVYFFSVIGAASRPGLSCKCYNNSRFRSGELCIGHVRSSVYNRFACIPLPSTYSRFIQCHSQSFKDFFTPSIYTADFHSLSLSHCSHSFYYSSLSLLISLHPFPPCARIISEIE